MKRIRFLPCCIAAVGVLALCASPALTQTVNVIWNVTDGDYNDGSNWGAGFVPNGSFDEVAIIDNGGLAHLSAAASEAPGGVTINGGSTLELRSGADLSVEVAGSTFNNGSVSVTNGSLVALAGSSLSAEGNLGVGGSGTLQVDGPNVTISAGSFSNNGTIAAGITGASHSAIDVSADATLAGTLAISFSGVTPTFGDTWDIVDAQSISGSFSSVTSNTTLATGLVVAPQIVNGGNGQIAQVTIDSQLVLQVDRQSGALQISDIAGVQATDIDGYLITSPSGLLDPNGWTSFTDAGEANWEEANPAVGHLSELNLSGSRAIAANASIGLGNVFGHSAFGNPDDLSFEYHTADGNTRVGAIEYTGPNNTLVLIVDPDTGDAALQNQSAFDVEIDAYLVNSASSALDTNGWVSLEDAGSAGWEESNPAANHVAELNLDGGMMLAGRSAPISLGTLFTPGSDQDLELSFHVAGGSSMAGVVQYGVPTTPDVPGDYDSDVFVGQGDIDLVLLNWGNDVSGGPPAGWTSNLPSGSVDQDELDAVLLNWGRSGALALGGAGSVPEPATWLLVVVVAAVGLVVRRKW